MLTPVYFAAAWLLGAPGIAVQLNCALLALRLFFAGRISAGSCYFLMFSPMDSTRYFEFHEVLKSLTAAPFSRWLDVSSPRLVLLLLLLRNKKAAAELINPDGSDARQTAALAAALGLAGRCAVTEKTIETAGFAPGAFDLVTCLSVLEHIPGDRRALETMWSLLRPGGRLVLTLPCMAEPLEQYISRNDYGVLRPEADGYTFWQRFYDEERLRSVIYSLTGEPVKTAVYGEREPGLFFRNAGQKRGLGEFYPFWRESYMLAREYRYYKKISELPGEGVVLLEFIKP